MTPYGVIELVYISSGNGSLPDGTKELPVPMLTNNQWSVILRHSREGNFTGKAQNMSPWYESKIIDLTLQPHFARVNGYVWGFGVSYIKGLTVYPIGRSLSSMRKNFNYHSIPMMSKDNKCKLTFIFVQQNCNLTLLMLETEYSGFGVQYHACWCSGS